METSVRMLCLLSLTSGGLHPNVYSSLKTQFAQVRQSLPLANTPIDYSLLASSQYQGCAFCKRYMFTANTTASDKMQMVLSRDTGL